MIREIIHDPIFLRQKSREATPEDLSVAADLRETLFACRDRCAGMAANMIIAFCNRPLIAVMMNPKIISKSGEYVAEEGCLSLSGVRQTRRYRKITVVWQDMEMKHRMNKMEGFAAQIVQHEIDHCDGILI